jgi:hypothetical protein
MTNKLIVATSILYNESVYMDEWIDFHLKQGADLIYLHVQNKKNEKQNNEVFNTMVETYKENEKVKLFHHTYYDYAHVHEFLKHDAPHHLNDWLAVLDIDEFLYSPIKDKSIKDIIYEYEEKDISAVLVNWKCFGSNNLDAKPEKVLPSYTTCSDEKKAINFTCKSITKISAIINLRNAHWFRLKPGLVYYTTNGVTQHDNILQHLDIINTEYIDNLKQVFNIEGISPYNKNSVTHIVYPEDNPKLVVNHYILRSKEEYMMKIRNNPQRHDRYNINIFNNINKVSNNVTNTDILMKI